MALRVAVDFGTSSTCVAVSVNGREPQVVVVDGQPLLRSAVYAATDGTLFVGQEAERQAALDPSRYEPHPKRRVDEAELLLGDAVLPVPAVFRAVLSRAVAEARRVAGGAPVDQLVLTHPADWGGVRTQVLRQAAAGLGHRIATVPEPVAAAVFHAASFPGPPQRALAVLDVGGGTVDVSVVRTQGHRHTVLATKGDPSFGGADVDQLLLEHIGATSGHPEAWRDLVDGRDLAERRRRRVLRQDVRDAKETLSRHPYTDVPLPSPFPDAHVTRDDLERLIAEPVGRAVRLVSAAVEESGLTPAELTGVFLVGGSSRIPLIARLVAERTGVVPVTLDQPETVVARGALRAVAPDPEGTGVLAPGQDRTVPTNRPPIRTAEERTRPVHSPGEERTRPVHSPAEERTRPVRGPAHRHPSGPLPRPLPTGPRPPGPPSGGFPAAHPGAAAVRPSTPDSARGARGRTWLLVGLGALVLAVAVAVTLVVVLRREEQPPADPGRVIAQYEYRFALPEGWTQTGGDPGLLRTEIRPADDTGGGDAVLVEEKRLSFDSGAERSRAVDKLRSDYEAGGDQFTDFADATRFADRDVVHYREQLDAESATVDWYVLFQGAAQVSVGCQYTDEGRDRVARACDAVVRSMVVTG
ncbi:type VII secretion-associated protein [Actinokineospora sp. PR83]|uniref:type VII secretion-associated protein n=1 Tax=Actinokineospora sp. PR83 TaxID=2884908 RepID=UPI0027E0D4C1|nr:type VII secretion-associated protein [Actinokineospora sp. PR83]MCG8916647.1 type VII secretion-associated protein [Actinokineospora sp. PR83]